SQSAARTSVADPAGVLASSAGSNAAPPGKVHMTKLSSPAPDTATKSPLADPPDAGSATSTRWQRVKREWAGRLKPSQQSVVIAWASFTATFAGVRLLTHWIHEGHGPSGGGISVGGKHFHH